jgi:hypothetical protein
VQTNSLFHLRQQKQNIFSFVLTQHIFTFVRR